MGQKVYNGSVIRSYLLLFVCVSFHENYRKQHGPVLLQAGGLHSSRLGLCISVIGERDLWWESILIQGLKTWKAGVSFKQDRTLSNGWAPCRTIANGTTSEFSRWQGWSSPRPIHQSPTICPFISCPWAVQLAKLLDALINQSRRRILVSDTGTTTKQHLELFGKGCRRHSDRGCHGGRRCRERRKTGFRGISASAGSIAGKNGDVIVACWALPSLSQRTDDLRYLEGEQTGEKNL